MFTGIVQAKATVTAAEPNPFGVRLTLDRSAWRPEPYTPAPGDSICVSGVCLTVTEADPSRLVFDVIAETLAKTTLGDLAPGDPVNLEPPVTPHQPLGGHFMQGHVDAVGTVTEVYDGPDEWRTTVAPPPELMDYIVPKGSIAIDGVSLTIADVADDAFTVALIPTTLELTTLCDRRAGARVNLEADILTKTVVHALRRMRGDAAPKLTMDALRDAGFVDS